jgi:hypothetical protein
MRDQSAEQLRQMRQRTAEEMKEMREQLDTVTKCLTTNSAQTSPQPSYADMARTLPSSRPSKVHTLSSSLHTTPSSFSDTWCCTIDTSRVAEEDRDRVQVGGIRQAIEEEVRTKDGQHSWWSAAVVKDVRNANRIKVICRDEAEMQLVKQTAQKTAIRAREC